MTFKLLSQEEFIQHTSASSQRSFMQTVEMAELLSKRGFSTQYVGYTDPQGQVVVSAVLYSMPMTGGLHMEINCGPVSTDAQYLTPFYQALQAYAKKEGALELIIKPYETYQTFDSNGQPTSDEKVELIQQLTDLGFDFDGLQTGYPGGEPDWHYVKDLTGLTEKNLLKSFSKNGKATVKKANTFGIKLKRLERDQLSIFKDPVTVRSYQGFRSGVVTAYHKVAAPHATAYGVHTPPVSLPNAGKATYTGIAFDATTSGNFVYNVDFGAKTGQGRIENMRYGKGLITLDKAPFQQERRLDGSITTKLEGTGVNKAWGDFKYRLDFYGNQAEEIAGYALRSGVDAIGLHGTRGAITQ